MNSLLTNNQSTVDLFEQTFSMILDAVLIKSYDITSESRGVISGAIRFMDRVNQFVFRKRGVVRP